MSTTVDHGQIIATDRIIEITEENRRNREPKLRSMRPAPATVAEPHVLSGFAMGYFGHDPDVEEAILEPLFTGLNGRPGSNRFGPVARVEFIYYHDDKLEAYVRGAGVFDSNGTPLFFSRNAYLGQKGRRALHSSWMMAMLGTPKGFFDEVSGAVGNQYDTVVISREAQDKELIGFGHLPVSTTWDWWIA